jgi:hypothetical protein
MKNENGTLYFNEPAVAAGVLKQIAHLKSLHYKVQYLAQVYPPVILDMQSLTEHVDLPK